MISKTGLNENGEQSPYKKQKLFSDFELHQGWVELCKNEKRAIIK